MIGFGHGSGAVIPIWRERRSDRRSDRRSKRGTAKAACRRTKSVREIVAASRTQQVHTAVWGGIRKVHPETRLRALQNERPQALNKNAVC